MLAPAGPRGARRRRRSASCYGLTLYRLERWRQAAAELEAYRALTGSADQLPVLADCYRALRRYDRVDELWAELREASPSAALVTEGRIVAAGALADQGDLQGAIGPARAGAVVAQRSSATTTCASGTRWPTCTTAPATPRGPGRCSVASATWIRSFADVSQRIANLR